MLALFGVSFLTPVDALFVLAAAAPIAAFLLTERRASRIRRLLALGAPARRAVLPATIALVLLPALVAVAAAQPVVVREQLVSERADAQGFVVIDTSLSMSASATATTPTRLERAKRIALALQRALPDVPLGVASMTDRALPNLMPTTDATLFDRVVDQSVQINQPPPSQQYPNRATTFAALLPLIQSHLFATGVRRRLLVVLTDGESARLPPLLRLTLRRQLSPLFVHVWQPGERIFHRGSVDPRYRSDPASEQSLQEMATITGSHRVYQEGDFGALAQAARALVGRAGTETHVHSYARVALAPWFVLAGALPLSFLLWRRNL